MAMVNNYQNVGVESADSFSLAVEAKLAVLNDHHLDANKSVGRLAPFGVVYLMLARIPLSREILARLVRLKPIASLGPRNTSVHLDYNIDVNERGI